MSLGIHEDLPWEVTLKLPSEDETQEVRLGGGRGFQAEGTA